MLESMDMGEIMELSYKPTIGQTLEDALIKALALSAESFDHESGKYPTVNINFNGVDLKFDPSVPNIGREVERCKAFYDSEQLRIYMEYEASPAGQAQKAARNKQVGEDRTTMDRLLKELDALPVNAPLPAVVKWIGEMAKVNDDRDVCKPFSGWKAHVPAKLKAMGYANNAFTGPEYDANDSYKSGAWLVGQAINCLESGMPIHPISIKFCHEWLTRWGYAEVK